MKTRLEYILDELPDLEEDLREVLKFPTGWMKSIAELRMRFQRCGDGYGSWSEAVEQATWEEVCAMCLPTDQTPNEALRTAMGRRIRFETENEE